MVTCKCCYEDNIDEAMMMIIMLKENSNIFSGRGKRRPSFQKWMNPFLKLRASPRGGLLVNLNILILILIISTKIPTSSVARAMRVGGRIARRGNIKRRENWDILGLHDDQDHEDDDDHDDDHDEDDYEEED